MEKQEIIQIITELTSENETNGTKNSFEYFLEI